METIHRFSHRLSPISITGNLFRNSTHSRFLIIPILGTQFDHEKPFKTKVSGLNLSAFNGSPKPFSSSSSSNYQTSTYQLKTKVSDLNLSAFNGSPKPFSSSSSSTARAGWFLGLGDNKKTVLPEIVKAGDPVLHEPARDVPLDEIGSAKIEKIIDDMIKVMRNAPGVGLAAPQIGIPLKIIVLEDTTEYISYAPKKETKEQDRRPFDLLVILNPKLEKKNNKTALFFEGCLSVDGFRAVVERHLEVKVTGLGRDGQPIEVDASGWQARILQHECDHLDGTIYVDKLMPRTFRTVQNLDLPLPVGCSKLGVC